MDNSKEGFTQKQIDEIPFSFLSHSVGDNCEENFTNILKTGLISPLEYRLSPDKLKTLIKEVKEVKNIYTFLNPPEEEKVSSRTISRSLY